VGRLAAPFRPSRHLPTARQPACRRVFARWRWGSVGPRPGRCWAPRRRSTSAAGCRVNELRHPRDKVSPGLAALRRRRAKQSVNPE